MNINENNLKNYVGFSDEQWKEARPLIIGIANKSNKNYSEILKILLEIAKAIKGEEM
jgi:hypothetical protein